MKRVIVWMSGAALAASCVLAGCGSSTGTAPRDAGFPDAAGAFGAGLVWNSFGLDPNSRDAFRNFARLINPGLQMAVSKGTFIQLMDLRRLDPDNRGGQKFQPLGVDIGFYQGTEVLGADGGKPPEFSGDTEFYAAKGTLKSDGTPLILFPSATLGDMMMPGHLDGVIMGTIPIPVPMGTGFGGMLSITNPEISGDLTTDAAQDKITGLSNGLLQGVLLERDLAKIPNPLKGMCTGDSLLDMLAIGSKCTIGGFTISLPPTPPTDDVDGDGSSASPPLLDSFADTDGDGVIDQCTPGAPGATPISGACNFMGGALPSTCCAENPKIGDGYRIVFDFTAVRAVILPPKM